MHSGANNPKKCNLEKLQIATKDKIAKRGILEPHMHIIYCTIFPFLAHCGTHM